LPVIRAVRTPAVVPARPVALVEPPAEAKTAATESPGHVEGSPAPSVDGLPFDPSVEEASLSSGAGDFDDGQAPDATLDSLPFERGGEVDLGEGTATDESPTPPEAALAAQGTDEGIAGPDARICGSCGAVVPEGFKFCGVCGSRYEAQERPAADVFVPRVQEQPASPARLVLIHPDGTEGEVFPLSEADTTVGRAHPSSLFAEDPFLSPRHATFHFVKGRLHVRDEGSLNGVFLRIKAEVELYHGDQFRLGQQLLKFEELSQVRPTIAAAGDGTTVMGSPVRGAWGRLGLVVAIDTCAEVWTLRKTELSLGRERGDVTFLDDGFVSGMHCKLSVREGRFFLTDLQSTNGSYLRIKGEGILTAGDLLLLGQQLFKVEISS